MLPTPLLTCPKGLSSGCSSATTRTPTPASSPPLSPRIPDDALSPVLATLELSSTETISATERRAPWRPWWRCSCRRRAENNSPSKPQQGQRGKACGERADSLRVAVDCLQYEMGPVLLEKVNEYLMVGETLDSCLIRFLKARSFDISAAAEMLRQDLYWRDDFNTKSLALQTRQEVLRCDSAILQRYLPQWHSGFDKEGRPVVIKQYGKARLQPLLQETSVDALLRLHVYENESIAKLCGQQTTNLGKDITKAVVIVDGAGFDACHLRMPKAYVWGKGMATIDQQHYPERLETLFLINAPSVLYYFWSMVSVVLDRKTQQKVRIFSTREQWEPALLEMIDANQLPHEYGGCCTRARFEE